MTAKLLGFDARHIGSEPERAWPPERRNTYLLREDVLLPLSVDTAVWPRLLDGESYEASSKVDWTMRTGPRLALWRELGDLRGACSDYSKTHSASFCVVAVSVIVEPGPVSLPEHLCINLEVPRNWDFWDARMTLGMDVADGDLLSALTNCGFPDVYTPLERERDRKQWYARLNQFSLFDDFEAADEFRRFSDSRIPEHAPFYVFQTDVIPDKGNWGYPS